MRSLGENFARIALVALILSFFGTMAFVTLRATLSYKLRSAGVTMIQIGALTSSFMLARALSAPVFGWIGDRVRNRAALVRLGFACFVSLTVAVLYITEWEGVVAIMFAFGLASGLTWPTLQTIVAKETPDRYKAQVLSFYFMAGSFGAISSGFVLSYLLLYGYFEAFLLAIMLEVAALLTSVALPKSEMVAEEGRGEKLDLSLIKSATFLLLLIFLMGFLRGTLMEFYYVYIKEVHEISEAEAMFLVALSGALGLGFSYLLSFVADRKGDEVALKAIFAMAMVGSAMALVKGVIPLVVLSTVLLQTSTRGFMPISRSMAVKIVSDKPGTMIGLVNTMGNTGTVLSPLVAGYLYEQLSGEIIVFGVPITLSGSIFALCAACMAAFLLLLSAGFLESRTRI